MTKSEFFHSTFKDVTIRIEAFGKNKEEKIEEIEFLAWLTGMYVTHSISCCFTKNGKYPENPLKVDTKDIKQVAKIT